MKQYTLCLISFFAILGLCTLPARAQNRVKAAQTIVKTGFSRTPIAPRVGALSKQGIRLAVPSSAASNLVRSASGSSVLPYSNRLTESSAASLSSAVSVSSAELQEKLQALERENRLLKDKLATKVIPSDSYIFQAVESGNHLAPTNIFSGTVVSVPHNGQNEIYGIVATHTIASSPAERDALHKNFTAVIYKNGLPKEINVEIVAFSPRSMLDIALVKFPAEAEPFLAPYRLSPAIPKINEDLSSKGFNHKSAVHVPKRKIVGSTPISIRTDFSVPQDERVGLCGSAVLNAEGELVGIHTGSLHNKNEGQTDVAFATHAHYIHNLVHAYHNGGKGAVPFLFRDRRVMDMDMDEYIAAVSLLDEKGKQIWLHNFESKFSYSAIETGLAQKPGARFLQLTTRRAAWTQDGNALLENRNQTDRGPKTTYLYDLQEEKLIRTSTSVYDPLTKKRRRTVIEHNNL